MQLYVPGDQRVLRLHAAIRTGGIRGYRDYMQLYVPGGSEGTETTCSYTYRGDQRVLRLHAAIRTGGIRGY